MRELTLIDVIDFIDTRRIVRDYYEQHYGSKFHNFDQIDKFFERHKPPKFTPEE